jgi:hypothetical protein
MEEKRKSGGNDFVMGGARQDRSDHVTIKGRENKRENRETQFQMCLIASRPWLTRVTAETPILRACVSVETLRDRAV